MTQHARAAGRATGRRSATVAALGLLALVAALTLPGTADAAPDWADPGEATITPGVQMLTEGAQCTANFVFTDGADVFLGYAAHCAGTGGSTATNGCDADTLPTGTEVDIEGASQPGTLAYSSWETMQEQGESDPSICQYNDFALVELHEDDRDAVNPTVPFWGGPDELGSDGSQLLQKVYGYGNSQLRLGIEHLRPTEGYSLGPDAGGWTHSVYTVLPGVPGDSGGALLDAQGRALGTVSTLALAPLPASNGVADLSESLAYAEDEGGMDVKLATGTRAFGGGRLLPDLVP